MQSLALENYGTVEMNSTELVGVEGGSGPWWYEVGKAIFHSAAYDIVKAGVTAAHGSLPGGGSGAYHDIMSSSNHGGIR